ncbi:unnamed protein product, partial [Cyprideis torosa]
SIVPKLWSSLLFCFVRRLLHLPTSTGEKRIACRICEKAGADRSAQVISGFQESKSLEERTRRREKLYLQNLWEIFGRQPPFIHAQVDTCWRKRNSVAVFVLKDFEARRDFTITKRNTLKGLSPVVLCVISLSEQWKTSKST